jgi:hypothetical protein
VIPRKLFMAISEALMIYGLIIVGYGILVIHVTETSSGGWRVDRNFPARFSLDIFVTRSSALSFFGFIAWRYLKYTQSTSSHK